MPKKLSRGEKAGRKMADALLEWAHMMYNRATAIRVIQAVIDRLTARKMSFLISTKREEQNAKVEAEKIPY